MRAGAIILAGGKSSRMGQNKALLSIQGSTNVERIKKNLLDFEEIVLVANDESAYTFLQVKTVADLVKDQGPLAGIQAGLIASQFDTNIVVACDMPFISSELAQMLVNVSEGFDAVVPVIGGREHPLFSVYKKSILPEIEVCLQEGHLRLKDLLQRIHVKYVTEDDFPVQSLEKIFYNMNNPSEYEEAKKLADQ